MDDKPLNESDNIDQPMTATGKKTLRVCVTIMNILLTVVIVILAAVLIISLIFQPCLIEGPSMMPTLQDDQMILLKKGSKCRRGDIVVIKDVSDRGNIVKRVIGVGGDKLVFRVDPDNDERVQLLLDDGSGFIISDEYYIFEPMLKEVFDYQESSGKFWDNTFVLAPAGTEGDALNDYAIVIPADEIFFMGDNRNVSQDSRYYGTQPVSKVIGRRVESLEDTIIQKLLELIGGRRNYSTREKIYNLKEVYYG